MKHFIYIAICCIVLIGQSVYGQRPYHFPRPEDFTNEVLDPLKLIQGPEIYEHKNYSDLNTWMSGWAIALVAQGILSSMDEVGVSTAEIGTDYVLAPSIFATMISLAIADSDLEKLLTTLDDSFKTSDIEQEAVFFLHGNSGKYAKLFIRLGVEYGLKMCVKTVGTHAYRGEEAISALVDRTYARLQPLLPTKTAIEKIAAHMQSAESSSTGSKTDDAN